MSTPTAEFLNQMKDHMKTMSNLTESFKMLTANMSATIEGVEVGDDDDAAPAPAAPAAPAPAAAAPAALAPTTTVSIWQARYAAFLARVEAKKRAIYDKMISICNVIPSPNASIAFDNHYMAMQRLAVDLSIEYTQNKTNALGCRIDRLKEYEKGCWRTIKPHGLVMIYKYSVWKIVESPNAIESVSYLGAINPETKELHKNAAPAMLPLIAEWNWF
jgi:hypothetical protein